MQRSGRQGELLKPFRLAYALLCSAGTLAPGLAGNYVIGHGAVRTYFFQNGLIKQPAA